MDRTSRSFRAFVTLEHRVLGVAFLALLVFFGWLTYAIFNKTFTDYVPVTLQASKTGLQLPTNADVKIRGVLVGAVRGRTVTADGVRLDLGIYPDKLGVIPANVSARIQPKTLFGEKYVALLVPDQPAPAAITAGTVITQSAVSIEVEKVLSDIYPLLRAVQPADLNYTLTAVATALEGRGEQLGENLAVLDDYLQRVNPQVPRLVEDLRMLGDVSDAYRAVLPELARLLRNTVTTGTTFLEKEQKIQALFDDVAAFSGATERFLERNGENIIRLADLSRAQLPVFAKYAPEYPCLLNGIVDVVPREAEAFRGHTLHINLELLPTQPRGYGPQDDPVYGAKNGPPTTALCERVLSDYYGQDNLPPASLIPNLDDGVDEPTGKGGQNRAPVVLGSGLAGTGAERTVVNAVAGPALGVRPGQVPDVASLLFGPMARGTEVSLR
jgi:phospholipid/cholesterol/gamma-HCH transport system substrate-binding protein